MGLGTAFRAFFVALGRSERALAIRRALEGDERKPTLPEPIAPAKPALPVRSEALSLLATLQREARLIDLVQEPLDGFTDAQIGAAARPCLKQCQQVLERMFVLQPVSEIHEGGMIKVPQHRSPMRFQTLGDQPLGLEARVVHPGWQATVCKVPQFTGRTEDVMVVAAIQVEAT